MAVSTTQVVVSPMVEVAPEGTTSSKEAAAAAGRLPLDPSPPEYAHDMSINGTTE